jgi:hypothetical protein
MLRKWEDEASTGNHKGKQVMEVDFDHYSSLLEKSDDEQFSRDSYYYNAHEIKEE